MPYDFLDGCLEYLASQTDAVVFESMLSCLLAENDLPPLGTASKAALWLRLYRHIDVLVLSNHQHDDTSYTDYIRTLCALSDSVSTDSEFLEILEATLASSEPAFLEYIDNCQLLCSNSLRFRKLNLLFCEQIFKSAERYRILLAITSRRYNGYWQHDLVNDLGISPRDMFTYLMHMSKASILCKITVPQNRIALHVLKNKLNNNAKSRGPVDAESDGRDNSSFTTNHQATLWFHTRYFVINRLPDLVQEICFKTTNKEMEEYLLRVLDESENRIILESDWKQLYSSRMLDDLNALGTRVDGRMVSKSYMSFRRLLESRSKITRVFAWCPQTTRFERCIIPSVCAADILTHSDKLLGPVSAVNVLHLKPKRSPTVSASEAEHEMTSTRMLYQLPSQIHGHTLTECIYYLVKCHQDGVSIHDVMSHVGIRYKLATRIFSALEGSGVLKKEPVRAGKILMYLYTIKGRTVVPKVAKPMLTASKKDDGAKNTSHVDEPEAVPNTKRRKRAAPDQLANSNTIRTPYNTSLRADVEPETGDSVSGQVTEVSSDVNVTMASQGGISDPRHVSSTSDYSHDAMSLSYKEWLSNERAMYRTENDYVHRFTELFGSDFVLHKNVNTTLFRHRMVLLVDYIMYFKAASCATISSFYGDMENGSTKVDRKTVIRVADFVNLRLPHICRARGQDLEGVNFAVTVIYDSHKLNDYGAFQIVNEDIVKKRHLVSTHSSSLRKRINKSFKGPQDIPETVALSDPLDNAYIGPLNIEPPKLLKDVEVTKQNQVPLSPRGTVSFSQQCLSKNGYIFPVITRVKCLHRFLLELGSNIQRFSALQVLQKMPMDLYLQVIGCGYELNNVLDLLEGNILPVHLDGGVFDAIFKGRGNRDPVHLIHRMLCILSKLHLVKEHHDPLHPGSDATIQECQIEWEVLRFVTLPSFTETDQVIGRFDMLTSSDEFWQALQSEVDGYISLDKVEPPEIMPVHELFRKKNWKGSFCFDTKYRTQLDHSISTWFRTTCQGMDCRHLMKFMYMPPYIIKTFMHRHSISQESLFKYISHRIRNHGNSCAEIHGDSSIASFVKNLTGDAQYLWLSKFVLAERLCNAVFYDRFSCTNDCSLDGTITWGSLRAKFKELDERAKQNGKCQRLEHSAAPAEDKFDNTMESTNDASSVAMANGTDASLEKRSIRVTSGKAESPNSVLYCIWDLLSLMFDGLYSSEECRYIFEHIMNKSSLNLRTLCRLRELNAVDVTSCALKCRVPIYDLATNKIISQEHVKAMLKCLLFTPVVSMRPWFLDPLQLLKRGRSVLRQWSENGWVIRTKQSTNMSTLFKLSIFSRVKLFGKIGDLHFLANVLASHLGREMELAEGTVYHQFNHSTSLGSSRARSLVALNSSMPSRAFTCNSDDLDSYGTYSLVEDFVNGKVSFSPVWQNKRLSGGTRESMRAKMSYDRLNDGGLSRHIREMTSDVISIKSVNITIFSDSSDMRLPRGSNTSEKRHDRSKLLDSIISRDLTCGGRITDVLNPLACPSLLFTSRVSGHYPLCNFEYESDRTNDWWTDRNYLSVPLTKKNLIDQDMLPLSEIDEQINNSSGCFDDGNRGKTVSATVNKRRYDTPSITNIMLRVIRARFGPDVLILESKVCNMGNYLFELVRMVMSAGKDGIVESALREQFLSKAYKEDKIKMVTLAEGDMTMGYAVFEVLLLTAEVLRFVTRLASNEEFVYLYWEFSTTMCVPVQSIVAMRQYSKTTRNTASDCMSENPLERPEYVTPLLWLLYEENMITELSDDDLSKILGPLNELLKDAEIRKAYLEHRMKVPLGTFTSIDGHINRCLLAFLMLRIANILKNVPGQSLKEVWDKLVVLDLCEVDLLLRSMVSLRMCSRSPINVSSCSNMRHDGGDSSSTISLHFVREESLWLPKFKHVLLPFLN